jgi:chromosome segregation ATPase
MLSEELSKSVAIALAGLKAINAKAEQHAKLPAKLAREKAHLEAITQKLDRAKAELADAEPKLAAHQAKIKHDYENEIMVLRAQLEKGWIEEEKANQELGRLDAAIRDQRAINDGLVHAIATLSARLEGKSEVGLIERLGKGEFHA